MQKRQSLTREQIGKQLAADPVLSHFIAPFPALLSRGQKGIAQSFKGMAKLVGAVRRAGCIQFTISNGRKGMRYWCLTLGSKGSQVSEDHVERPDLEVLTSEKVWLQIAKGELSPLEAFGRGNMRVRGDIVLASFLARKLQKR